MRKLFLLLFFVFSSFAQWTMIKNNSLSVNWGTRYVFAETNTPGLRKSPIMFAGQDTRYIFLGYGLPTVSSFFDDLWVFDRNISQWAWLTGNNKEIAVQSELIGDTSHPVARAGANTWVDSEYNLWLYGGYFNLGPDHLADMWKLEIYDGYNVSWTYLPNGDNVTYPITSVHATYDGANPRPGSRADSITWVDANDNLYLFAGQGYSSGSPPGADWCADLWSFSTYELKWTYIRGPQTVNVTLQSFSYGTLGVPSYSNWPRARARGTVWSIGDAIYMFGGQLTTTQYSSELWKWENFNWTWIGGPQSKNSSFYGSYGTFGGWSESSVISDRSLTAAWHRGQNQLWQFGGLGLAPDTHVTSELEDIWVYDLDTHAQAWVYPTPNGVRPIARCRHGYLIIDDQLIIYGGIVQTENYNLGDMWSLDLNWFGTISDAVEKDNIVSSKSSVNIAAIVVPIVVVTVIFLGIVLFLYIKKKKKIVSENDNLVAMEAVVTETPQPSIPDSELMQGVTVEFLIGSGNFGEVYRGLWQKTPVALKKIKQEFYAQFRKEFSVLSNLKHPAIVQYLGIYVEIEVFIVMELMTSGDLKSLLQTKEFSEKNLLKMCLDAASALVYLHDNNLIHRDIALRNYLASELGNGKIIIKLSDFVI